MNKSREPIKLGVIGCGWVTQTWHAPALTSVPGVELVAVADVDPSQANLVAERFHVPYQYRDAIALLNCPALNAVAVCVPPRHHAEIASAAIDAGKSVFIEKPLALSMAECNGLVERAEQKGATVMVGFNLRWHRLIREARALIHDGALGSISAIRTAFTSTVYQNPTLPSWRRDRTQGGGVLHDMATHHFDLWRFLLESEVEEIFVTSRPGRGDDETATITARMSNQVLVSALFSAGTSDSHEVELYGNDSRVRLACYRFDGLEYLPTNTAVGLGARLRQATSIFRGVPNAFASFWKGGEMLASYRAQWCDFIQCLAQKAPVQCGLEDGRRALQVAVAAVESASCGRPVRVTP